MTVSTLNTILILSFVAVILASLLAGLIGFLKGIYKTGLKCIIKAIFVLILIFLTPAFSILIGNINLQGVLNSENAITLQTYLANLITDLGVFSPINAIEIYATCFAIASSLISFVVFLIGMILIQLTASFFTFVLYQGVFRFILPVESKKERKFRKKHKEQAALKNGLIDENQNLLPTPKKKWSLFKIPASILGAVQEFIFVLILLTPIFSLARTAIENRNGITNLLDTSGVSEENKTLVNSYLDTIDDSILYKIITYSQLDNAIINKATSSKLNNSEITFNMLVSSSFELINPLIENKTISYDTASKKLIVNYASLLSLTSIDGLVDTLLANPMLLTLIPPLLDMSLNSISSDTFALSSLDFSNIDFSSEISTLRDIYKAVYETGIKPLLNENDFDVDNYMMKVSSFTEKDINTYVDSVRQLGSMEVIKKNMPKILSSLGIFLNQKGYNIFPVNESSYQNIDWSNDLAIFTNIALRLFKMLNMDISSKMDGNQLKDNLITALKDEEKRKELQSFVCSDENTKGVLETDLFSVISIPDMLYSSFSTIPAIADYSKALDYEAIFSSFTIENYRYEFNAMFDMLNVIFAKDSKIDINHIIVKDFSDEEMVNQLVDLLKIAKRSKLFSSMYPSLMKTLLFKNNIVISDYLFGLTPYNFNYDSETFLDDFTSLLEMMPQVQKMVKNLNDSTLSKKERIQSLDVSVIEKVLTLVTASDFFNSDQNLGISSQKQKNANIYTLLSTFFDTDIFKSVGFIKPDLNKMQNIAWTSTGDTRGEINIICQIIYDLQQNAAFLTSESHSIQSIDDTSAFADALANGLQSKIFSDSILKIIDNSLNVYFEKMGFHMTLSEMRTQLWIDDCDNIADILSILQEFDLDFLSLKNLDMNLLNAFLTTINKTNLIHYISSDASDPFGNLLYLMMKKIGIGDTLNTNNITRDIFVLKNQEVWSSKEESYTYTKIDENGLETQKTFIITEEGELYNLVSFLGVIQKYMTIFSSADIPTTFFNDIEAVLSSRVIRKILSYGLNSMINNLSIMDSFKSFTSCIDFSYFASLDNEEAKKEMKLISHISSYTKKMDDENTYFSYLIKNILKLKETKSILLDETKTMEDDLYLILDEMSSSSLMNKLKEGYSFTPMQMFLKNFISETNMSEALTLYQDKNMQDSVINSILLSNSFSLTDEISTLKSILHELQGLSFDFILDNKIEQSIMKNLLTEMNSSALFHRYPIYIMKKTFNTLDISSYLIDDITNTVLHPLDFYVHLTNSNDDIQYWKNDIDMLISIAYDNSSISKLIQSSSSISHLDICDDDVSIDFIYYIGKMNIFSKSRSYLVYNLLNRACVGDFKITNLLRKSTTAPYLENEYVYKIEELYYSNPKLYDSNSNLDETKALYDLKHLKNVISLLLKKASSLAVDKTIDIDFKGLAEACVSIKDDTTFYRSSLASELVVGGLNQLCQNPHYSSYFTKFNTLDFYNNDYFLCNSIEFESIKGIINLVNVDYSIDKTYITYEELKEVLPCFGRDNISSLENNTIYQYFISLNEYQTQKGNSFISFKLIDVLSKLIVKKQVDLGITTINNISSMNEEVMQTISFQKYLERLEGIIL